MRVSKEIFFVAFLCLVLGFAGTVQIRRVGVTGRHEKRETGETYIKHMQAELDSQKNINERLNRQLAAYASDIEDYKLKASDSDGYAEVLAKQLEDAKMAAGLCDVTGPGIVVTVADKRTDKTASSEGTNLYVVHQEDLLKIINELRDADAEAISVNDERLIATSEIRCAGSTVSVNNRRYSVPYKIKAIGNPENLLGALKMKDGVIDSLGKFLEIDVSKEQSINIPAYGGNISYKYAKAKAEDE